MRKVIIVGAGIAGLTAGVYARQSGFDVTIYESHSIPGGASTSWRRKGYLFEGGMHWLTGSAQNTPLNTLWREIGALNDSVSIYNRDPFFSFELDGRTAHLYRDVDKLRQHFLEISPEDRKEILSLCRDVRKFSKISMPITDIKGVKVSKKSPMPLSLLFGMIPALARMSFYTGQTSKEYAERFKSPLLRHLLEGIVGSENSASGLIFTIATLAAGDGGYPEGGSLSMAARIAKYFEALGGSIRYGKTVSRVVVENGVARGVIVNGETIEADAVIVTRDTLTAIDSLFDTPIREQWAMDMRQNTKPMLDTFIGIGVEADLSGLPENLSFVPDEPIICGGKPMSVTGFYNYAKYKDYAPKGCTALTTVFIDDSYAYWKACRENGTYEAEKQKLAEAFIRALTKKFPQIEGRVSVWDVATPLTYERYLGSYKGSWMTIMGKGEKNRSYPTKPETMAGVYFAGQRLMPPGGLPTAAETGRRAVQFLCKDTDTVFQGQMYAAAAAQKMPAGV